MIRTAIRDALALALLSTAALADSTGAGYPAALVDRPLTLPKGMTEINGTLGLGLYSGALLDPITIAPGIRYGVDDKLEAFVTTDASGGFGFQPGLCLGDACFNTWSGAFVGAAYSVLSNPSWLGAVHGALGFGSFNPAALGLNVGFKARWKQDKIVVYLDPNLTLGLTNRDGGNTEFLAIPVQVQYQATPVLAAYITTGFGATLDAFGDTWGIPVGVGALYNVNKQLDVGGEFKFADLIGNAGGADFRSLSVFVNFRL